ncbi:MAG TPA: aldehyde dehydrogenase family protein [Conexibacter sp.]|jgi:acyl-CoA reductase-like NAD-dependent aldehyde dehydrogenase
MIEHDSHFIDGVWTTSRGPGLIEVVNPATEQVVGHVPAGGAADVDAAVAAARAALPAWRALPAGERAAALRRIAAGVRARQDEIVDSIVVELGTPRSQAVAMQAGIVAHTFEDTADALERRPEVERIGNSEVRWEPVGVVGAITPWNFTLYQLALKVAPALGVGCTVVAKPSEVVGLTPYLLGEIVADARLPNGVLNLVWGDGPVVGEAIASHPGIDAVSFTGSNRAGRRVAELASATVKPVSLELGGKSPSVVLDDADLAAAVPAGVANCFANNGQVCAALTRMIVPRDRLAEVERLAAEAAAAYVPGDPNAEGARLGPVVSAVQRDRVLGYLRAGVEQGARVLVGGPDGQDVPETGYYVAPTVFSDVDPQARIAQEEIFGPVLAIIPVDSEEEAVAVANGTPFGLNAAVWSADAERAARVASRVDASTVYINGASFNPSAPFGGTKQSGYGRERGAHGLDEFVRTKAYQV